MTKTEDFIATLHVIAASHDPLDRQKAAVREVLARFLRDAQQSLGGERLRMWITSLEGELTRQALRPHADRFAVLRDHAHALVEDWLRDNPR